MGQDPFEASNCKAWLTGKRETLNRSAIPAP